ncbi:MAG: class I SAM-dependent methyltransferase [Candidatus Thorarchaeota archaeon]|nr:MAG: class I SAM-dependent methyltransferase [Candidatus Thorarchaeota archaeon]
METEPNLDLARELLKNPRYPRTCKYDPEWMVGLDMGCPTLWLLERLCEVMELKPGMRVLDLGCGKAAGSIFLAKEFGVEVWAADLWIPPTENWTRVREAGVESLVFPIHADARKPVFAQDFFDAMIGLNSLFFFATDDVFLPNYLVGLVKPGGQFGIVVPGFYKEFEGDLPKDLPEHLKQYWISCMLYSWHSGDWWKRHWLKTDQVEIELVDNFPDKEGFRTYLDWERIIGYKEKIAEDDAGRNITFVRLVARRNKNTPK